MTDDRPGYERKWILRSRAGVGQILEWTGVEWSAHRGLLFETREEAVRALPAASLALPERARRPAVESVAFTLPRTTGPQLALLRAPVAPAARVETDGR